MREEIILPTIGSAHHLEEFHRNEVEVPRKKIAARLC